MKRILFLFTFIFLWQNVFGQISFSTEIARDSMQIGDHNTYKIKIVHSPDVTIRSVDLNPFQMSLIDMAARRDTSIANNEEKREALKTQLTQQGLSNELMEIIDWGNWTSLGKEMKVNGDESNWKSENIGEQMLKTNQIKFTFWEEGRHVVFSPVVEYQQNGAVQIVNAPEVAVMVGSPLSTSQAAADTSQVKMDPIKDILEEPLNIWRDILLPYGGGLLGIVGLVSLIYFLVKKMGQKEPPPPEPIVIIPAHETALEKLDALEKAELWQNENIKEYQSQLTYIIREYLENRYDINALENTTVEIKKDLKKLSLDDTLQNELQNILQVADLVKFAKAKPGASVHQEFMEKAKEFVLQTKKEIPQIEESKFSDQAQTGKINLRSKFVSANISDRFFAQFIDSIIFMLIFYGSFFLLFYLINTLGLVAIKEVSSFWATLINIIALIFYFPYAESKYGYTYGKKVLNLHIQNSNGENLSFGIALLRFFLKYLSAIILLPLFLAFFNPKRQTLHDKLTKSYVVKKID